LEYNDPSISGNSLVYGLIGDPVDHSMSPVIQNAAFRSAGIGAVYVPFRVKQSALRSAIQGLRALGVKGFNVTAPHKVDVIQYLDKVDRTATEISSVNTVLNESGTLLGYNTDGLGALKALEEAGAQLERKSILLFGAGGASRAIAYTFAPRVRAIRLVNRTLSKAKQLERRLRKKFNIDIESVAPSSKLLRDFYENADIIVNASSMGMDGKADPPIEGQWLHQSQWVFDIVYRPLETKLLKLGGLAGAKTISGLDMLVNQGACSFELWTGREAPILEMRDAIAQKLLAMAYAKSS
jgi:shikimate dehydrogenase